LILFFSRFCWSLLRLVEPASSPDMSSSSSSLQGEAWIDVLDRALLARLVGETEVDVAGDGRGRRTARWPMGG
jgi:hypothetical protein